MKPEIKPTGVEGKLKRGDVVRVRLAGTDDEWARAFVALASDTDPASVALWFVSAGDGVRCNGGFIFGALPLTVDYDAETVEGLTGDSYEIEVRPRKR